MPFESFNYDNNKPEMATSASWDELHDLREARLFLTGGAPENTPVIREQITTTLRTQLEDMNLPQRLALNVMSEINQFGQDQREVLKQLISSNRILALGEAHSFGVNEFTPSINSMREIFRQSIPDLVQAGATHFVIETPQRYQAALDHFMLTGDASGLSGDMQETETLNLLRTFRQEALRTGRSLRIIAGDSNIDPITRSMPSGGARNQQMANAISEILEQNPNNRVIFLVGANHLNRTPGGAFSVSDLLRNRYSMATVLPVYDEQRDRRYEGPHPLADITAGINRPIAVPTALATNLGSLVDGRDRRGNSFFTRDWDYAFIFPHQGRH